MLKQALDAARSVPHQPAKMTDLFFVFSGKPEVDPQYLRQICERRGWDYAAAQQLVYRMATLFARFMTSGKSSKNPGAKIDLDQLRKGIKVEMEHTPDEAIAMKIAVDHLCENARYYIELEKMEAKLEGKQEDPARAAS